MITIADRSSPWHNPISKFLEEHGYEYKRDWDYKIAWDHGGRSAFNITAKEHCPELETLLVLRYNEYIISYETN